MVFLFKKAFSQEPVSQIQPNLANNICRTVLEDTRLYMQVNEGLCKGQQIRNI